MVGRERQRLYAELGAIRELLGALRPENVFERRSLQSRVRTLEKQLAETPLDHSAKLVASFDGDPVLGRAGIDAKFGGTMLVELQDLVSRVHLQRVGGSGAKTPRDDRASRLQFTGTVLGSFGFTLEEAQASLFPSRLSEAIEASLVLFDAAATDDETFIEAIADSDPRVLGALKKMVEGMYKAGATVRFITPEKEVALDKRRVEAAWERTGRVEVDQEVLWLQGIFLGVLGDSRRFEFAIENGDVIGGRVLPTLDSETLAGWNARYFRQRCAAQVVSVTSRTAGKSVQKHTLITLAERIPDTTEEPGPEATPAAESARPRGRS